MIGWDERLVVLIGGVNHWCGGRGLCREAVHIEVEDVNEFSPTWRHQSMSVDVVEGRVYDFIERVEAVDRDGVDGLSRICRYHIVTPDVPFDIDADGLSLSLDYFNSLLPPPHSKRGQLETDISQGSVETCLSLGDIFNDNFITDLLPSLDSNKLHLCSEEKQHPFTSQVLLN